MAAASVDIRGWEVYGPCSVWGCSRQTHSPLTAPAGRGSSPRWPWLTLRCSCFTASMRGVPRTGLLLPELATVLIIECESADRGTGWQIADLLVELAEQVDADDEVDRLDVGEPDLAAQDGGDLKSVHLRGGRRDALAFRARCQPGEQVPILPLGDVERGRQVLRARPFPGERGFQGVQPPEPVVGAEEDITKGRGE